MKTWGETRKAAIRLLSLGDEVYEICRNKILIKRYIIDIVDSERYGEIVVLNNKDKNTFCACKLDDIQYNLEKHRYYFYNNVQILRYYYYNSNPLRLS